MCAVPAMGFVLPAILTERAVDQPGIMQNLPVPPGVWWLKPPQDEDLAGIDCRNQPAGGSGFLPSIISRWRPETRISSGGQPSNIASVGHEDRHVGHGQDMTGGSAQYHLAQPALSIGALDQEIAAELASLLQDGFASAAALRYMKGLCRDPGPHERAGHLVPGRTDDQAAFDRQHDDPGGLLEQRAGEGDRAGRLGAGVPAITIVPPICEGALGGATRTGRPLSNRRVSSTAMRGGVAPRDG
jgi:hypothetical protein